MHIGLFDNGLFVLLAAANAVLVYYLLQKLLPHKSLRLILLVIAGSTVIVSGFALLVVKQAFPADKMPPNLWFMVLPFSLSMTLLGICIWLKRFKLSAVIAAPTMLLGLLVSLLLVNSYYHYYPTIGSLFGKADTGQTTTIEYPNKTKVAAAASIEGQLYDSNIPTAGRISSIQIPGTVSKFKPRTAYVYEPAVNLANSNPNVDLPVVVLMAGIPGNPADWVNAGGLATTMDTFAAKHHGVTPYVVVVDNIGSVANDTECVDSPRGNVETYLSVDVPNYIKTHYSVSHTPSQWAIGGLSIGGMCGIMITLRHTDVYHYFLDFGGEVGPEAGSKQKTIATLFNGSETAWQEHQPEWLLANRKYKGIGGFFAVGQSDKASLVSGITRLHEQAQAVGLETVLQMVGGQHTFNVWQQSYKDALPWISNRLGATTCSANCY